MTVTTQISIITMAVYSHQVVWCIGATKCWRGMRDHRVVIIIRRGRSGCVRGRRDLSKEAFKKDSIFLLATHCIYKMSNKQTVTAMVHVMRGHRQNCNIKHATSTGYTDRYVKITLD
jgi:hypothetical protein